ncbi:zinc finger BED domain-containing protein RICESLEEPER 2-like [Juglans microcarpa x Juglans regia]|uniref:zinc finger BED domain-containing protein RICESLEEPER 2-like n=1 Tax=Juglans microcarpa x Juglans regia TaxID=2249226 RepID=UPI001B7F078C|nr:zinc finger BED domain-containing protein RICESLEEPER 2-like [Juglans microcarpa x Juglans regia]
MLESALELRKVFSLLEVYDRGFVAVNPSVEEWDMAIVVYKCLKVLYDAVCCFSGSKCLTANVYFPKVCSIHLRLLELQKSEHTNIRSMAIRMKEKFDKHFRECRTVLAIAVILDPQKKFDFVQFAFKRLNGCDEAERILTYIRNTLNDVFEDYVKELSMHALSSSSVSNRNSNNFSSHFDNDNCDMLDMWYESKHRNFIASSRAELDRYLEGEIIDNAYKDFDILGWWRANSLDFPTIGKMALDILGISMSTCVISDSSFDTEAMTMINPVFYGLDLEIIEALVCGEYWLDRPTKKTLNKEDEHSSCYSLNGGHTDHDHTSMALAMPSLSNSEFDQEKSDSPSAANTRLVLGSPSSILSPEIICSPVTSCSPTFPLTVPEQPLSPPPYLTAIMALSPINSPPKLTSGTALWDQDEQA